VAEVASGLADLIASLSMTAAGKDDKTGNHADDVDDLDDLDEGDELPAELDVTGYVGAYLFPDTGRRRIPGFIYLGFAALCLLLWAADHEGGVFVNDGFLVAGILLALVGVHHVVTARKRRVDDTDALVAATREVGFAVGHASAQLSFRGIASRPTWRILLYSAEDPPQRRGLVLVDAIDESIVAQYVEDNPEDWSALDR
jgi:hypothetical protein